MTKYEHPLINYACTACGFVFARRTNSSSVFCPECGGRASACGLIDNCQRCDACQRWTGYHALPPEGCFWCGERILLSCACLKCGLEYRSLPNDTRCPACEKGMPVTKLNRFCINCGFPSGKSRAWRCPHCCGPTTLLPHTQCLRCPGCQKWVSYESSPPERCLHCDGCFPLAPQQKGTAMKNIRVNHPVAGIDRPGAFTVEYEGPAVMVKRSDTSFEWQPVWFKQAEFDQLVKSGAIGSRDVDMHDFKIAYQFGTWMASSESVGMVRFGDTPNEAVAALKQAILAK